MRRAHRQAAGILVALVVMASGSGVASAENAVPKIVFLNVAKTFDSYQRTIESDKRLSATGAKKQEDHTKLVEEIKKLREGLDLLSDKAKDERQKQLEDKMQALQAFEQAARTELTRERDSIARQILQEIDTALQEYAKTQGYDLILNERVVVFGSQPYDITDAFITWLNQRYKP